MSSFGLFSPEMTMVNNVLLADFGHDGRLKGDQPDIVQNYVRRHGARGLRPQLLYSKLLLSISLVIKLTLLSPTDNIRHRGRQVKSRVLVSRYIIYHKIKYTKMPLRANKQHIESK